MKLTTILVLTAPTVTACLVDLYYQGNPPSMLWKAFDAAGNGKPVRDLDGHRGKALPAWCKTATVRIGMDGQRVYSRDGAEAPGWMLERIGYAERCQLEAEEAEAEAEAEVSG